MNVCKTSSLLKLFYSAGSLAVKEGEQVVPVINKLISPESVFDYVIYSLDWHPKNHISFISNIAERKLDQSSKVRYKIDRSSIVCYKLDEFILVCYKLDKLSVLYYMLD